MSSIKSRISMVGLILIGCGGSAAVAQDAQEIYDFLRSAQGVLDEAIRGATDGEHGLPYELVSRADFDHAMADFQGALQGGDLEVLARWLPDAKALLAMMDSIPGLEPYADWLRQRLDYAAIAEEAVRKVPKSVPKPPPSPTKKPKPLPPPATKTEKPTPPAPEPAQGRGEYVGDVDSWSRLLAGRPVPKRAAKLVPGLKEIFSVQGVPPELVWIAEVESTFNPSARSPAGAVGLFQLMPATAEHLGLKVRPKDQRLDPTRNGRAAARYLNDLHARFEDWPLALAAYNGGEGRVSRLLKANGASNFEGISSHLPGETRMYVPKVLATIRHREGFDPVKRW